MSFIDAAPVAAMAAAIRASTSAFGQLRGLVGLQDRQLGVFLRHQIGATAGLELHDGFLALLDHLLDDREHLHIVEHDALVDFTLLDGGQ